MSSYTVTAPTGPSPVRNPGIRAVVTARAEATAHAERVAEQRQANRDREINDALAVIARIIAQPAPNSADIVALLTAKV
jgi:hypothetical protein